MTRPLARALALAFALPIVASVSIVLAPFGAQAQTALAPAVTSTTLDLSPVLTGLVEALCAVLAALAVPIFWAGWGWLQNRFKLSALEIDDATRATVDQGLQKALGYGIAQLHAEAAALTGGGLTIDVKSQILKNAASFALDHIPDALAHFGITPDQLAGMVEARLGMLAVGQATAPLSGAVANAPAAAVATS